MLSARAVRPGHLLWAASFVALLLFLAICLYRVDRLSEGLPSWDYTSLHVTDFMNDWIAAKMVQTGDVGDLYAQPAYNEYMQRHWHETVDWHRWSYPPHLLSLIMPLGFFTYPGALLIWTALGLGLLYWTIGHASPRLPVSWRVFALLSPASMVNAVNGQTGFFCAAFMLGGIYLLPKRPFMAGILLGLLTFKPQLGLLVLPMLLITRQWQAIASASITNTLLIALSIALWGWESWTAFFASMRDMQLEQATHFGGYFTYMMPGIWAAGRILGMPLETVWITHLGFAASASIAACWLLHQEGLTPRAILALALASFIVTPYAFNCDMTMISLALAVYLFAHGSRQLLHTVIFLGIWLAPVLVYVLNYPAVRLPFTSFFLLAGIIILISRDETKTHPEHAA